MQQVLGLKATGPCLRGLLTPRSPGSRRLSWGRTTSSASSSGKLLQEHHGNQRAVDSALATPVLWSHAVLHASASEGVVQYRHAAKVASAAEARWRRQLRAGDDVKSQTLFDEYQVARLDCHTKRAVLNYLIDQLGYVPTATTLGA
ncbi:MAG: transcriptional repressor TraM [Devosia sp.]